MTLNANRIITKASQREGGGSSAPARSAGHRPKGIMTVTAINPVSSRCLSCLLLGQGWHDAVQPDEDAVLTTVNIDRFSMTNFASLLTQTVKVSIWGREPAIWSLKTRTMRLPVALSWVWIIALMQIFGIQFNIVNIILATFIFGQGDDYTIFIVEGLIYERRTGKTILPQYRQSIILSGLIMLLGIGILVFAVHPAMHSLGVVTLIGMAVVLLMAVTIPPLLFRKYAG